MAKAPKRILKSDNVKLEGTFRLNVDQGVPASTNQKNTTLSSAQVRIVENHPEFAVLEVTCACGTKTHIRCDYNNAQFTEQGLEQNNNGENNNEN